MMDRLLRRSTLGSTALLALAAGFASPARAQTEPSSTATAQTGSVGEEGGPDVVVTGTRVVRDGFQAPTPLTVISQQEIQNSAPTNNLADFVNQLPALAGSTRPANSRLAISSGLAGINALNLRNLGEVRTLVLLDGRRSVGSSVNGLIDINTFPQMLVKSVEVVTGGASAAYGSDAVAGVVNFVLDKKYTGLKVAIDSGITDKGDGSNYSFNVAGGMAFGNEGRGHVLLAAELAHRDGIFRVDRDWNQRGFRTIANPAYTNTNGQPQNLVRYGTGTANQLPGGIIVNSAGGTANRLRGIYFGQGGSVNQFVYGTVNTANTTGATAPSLTTGGDWELADNARNIGLDAQDDRRGVFGRVSYEVADGVTLFAEGSYNWQETLFNAGPNISNVTLSASNPYLIQTLGAARLAGITSVTVGTTASDLPYRKNNSTREVQRYAIGAEGDFQAFGQKAVWNVYGQYGQTDAHEQLRDIMNTARMLEVNDAVSAPAGNALGVPAGTIVCRSSLTNPTNGCRPLNRLGIGVGDPAAIDYGLGDPYRDQRLKQTTAGANLSITPFSTWAGGVSVAVGAEYRKEEVSGFVPTEFQTGWAVGNFLPTFGSYDVKEAYLETVVPLGAGVEFNGAVRATDYSTSGYVTTWKVGTTWQPIDDIRFRVTRSRDIRAPNLNELFQRGTSRTNNNLTDPFTNRTNVSFRETTTGNTDLRPEVADTTSVGVVLQPRFIPGLSVSADAFLIQLKDAIGQFFAQDIINRCFEGRTDFCAAYSRGDVNGNDGYNFTARPFNFSRQTVRGIDFDATYRVPLESIVGGGASGNLTLHGLATRYIDNIVNTGLSIPFDGVGQNGSGTVSGTPKWIYRFSATYDTDDFSITGTARGISAGNYLNNFIECQTNCPVNRPAAIVSQFPTVDDNSVSGLFYVDLNLTTKVEMGGANAQLFFNVTNLFDRDPLLLPEGGLSANSTYSDLLGRAFRVGIRMETR